MDLPGYGYARGGADSVERTEGLTLQYFDPSRQAGRQLAGVLHLVDARHPALDSDADAHEWLSRTGVAIAVVATKIDKLTQSEQRSTCGYPAKLRHRDSARVGAHAHRVGRDLEGHPRLDACAGKFRADTPAARP